MILSEKDILSSITNKSYDIVTLHILKKLMTIKTVDGIVNKLFIFQASGQL